MIIYEIEANVQRELIEKFEQFMNESHIPDMLETGHFMNAEMRMLSEDSYQIKYYCEDRDSCPTGLGSTYTGIDPRQYSKHKSFI